MKSPYGWDDVRTGNNAAAGHGDDGGRVPGEGDRFYSGGGAAGARGEGDAAVPRIIRWRRPEPQRQNGHGVPSKVASKGREGKRQPRGRAARG
jgi:hypothetical protein